MNACAENSLPVKGRVENFDAKKASSRLRQWRVWPVVRPEWARVVSAFSRGKAISNYLRSLQECWDDARFIDMRAEVVPGGPETSSDFIRCAVSRGLPDLRCGARVMVAGSLGTVVGHNASANFQVLFDTDAPKYAGMELNVHPASMEVLGGDS